VLLYIVSLECNLTDESYNDISGFWVMRLHPKQEYKWRQMTPSDLAFALLRDPRTYIFKNLPD
jgi:hypothetical protein